MIKTAMIVEDCQLTLHMTKFLLMRLGIETIFTVNNLSEFKQLLNKDIMPDLVITDWNIDKHFKGYDVIKEMVKLGTHIAVLSSDEDINNQSFYKDCHWFKKPLNFKQLSNWMHTIYS